MNILVSMMSQLLDCIEINRSAPHSTTPRFEMENRQVIMSRIGKYPGRFPETIRCNGGIIETYGQILTVIIISDAMGPYLILLPLGRE